ncbi:2-methoxy-6-polyprenyl-1,4-benzoquinol methylase, mitochondrial [Streptomyces badius]
MTDVAVAPDGAAPTTPFDHAERRIWSGKAEAYADTYARLCAHPAAALLDAAEVGPGVRVLDVGCGSGTVSAAAVARGATVYAADAEPGMVAATRRAVPGAMAHVARLPELPYADAVFDAAVGNFVLNHVGRPLVALAELRRITRPGGRVAVTIWRSPGAPGQTLIGRAARPPASPAPTGSPLSRRTTTSPVRPKGSRPSSTRPGSSARSAPRWPGSTAVTRTPGGRGPSGGSGRSGRSSTAEARKGWRRHGMRTTT